MPTNQIDLASRTKTLDQRVASQLERCQTLTVEVQSLTRDRKSVDRMNRGVFVEDLINEAQSKLVECQIVGKSLAANGDVVPARLAIVERWTKSAIDLLNFAQQVLDDQLDIWGKPLPTGGLWDK
jgi:hypothetical protein